jgi:signal transduction histidine kinase/DNA-binding response OmpR family regulator
MEVNGRVILKRSLLLTKEITLTHGDKNFSVEFAALHYSNPKGNRYKYKLENYDNDWISTDAYTRRASYSDLPANTYYLKVLASNSDGCWSVEPAVLKIIVLPPWWLTWWAYFIYFTIIGLIFFFSYQYIVSKIQFRNQLLIEQLKVEKEKELAQMKMQFFTNVSHEFRTPLSLIVDPLERLIREKIPQPKAQNYYTLMYKNAQRLLNLINQLLDFRKIESGNLQLKLSVHDIVPFIKNIAEAFEFHASQRNIQFLFNTTLESLPLVFDPEKLDKIIYNLLSNAFKYTSDGGKIELDFYQTQSEPDENGFVDFVVIKVSDNGIGISPSYLDKIFDVFYQVDDDGNKPRGTGIGLALTKELVKLHKGKIAVKSEVGKGSLFVVFLPIIPYQEDIIIPVSEKNKEKNYVLDHANSDLLLEEDVSLTPQTNIDTGENHQPLILIVDDNNDVRAYLRSNLEDTYQIMEAKHGAEGVARAIELVPDLIISDIMMPGIDGIELCRKLKTDEHTSHIPIILLTARQSDEYKIEGYETGADAYITKPFNTAILQSRIKNLLDSRQRLRELFSKGSSLEVKKIAINVTDEAFINKVLKLIEENMSETNFDTDALAGKLRMSRSQLYRKIKALTNQTVHDFISTFRMNKAAELLLNGELSISEVAYKVGYTLHTNFTRSFVKQFGETPSKYIESFRKGK